MGLIKLTFVDQETVITASFLNELQDQIIIDEETVEDVEKVQKVANAGKAIMIGLDGKLSASSGSGLTDRAKSALLGIFQHVAYVDDQGQTYYNELYDALNSVELTGVEATFNQGTMEVYPSTSLDSLRKNLVVKAVYSNGEKVTTDDYTLSGTLQVGTSAITVTCEDYTDTFDVNVSSVVVTGIECVFNQGTAVVYESDSLTRLKQYLTVKVVYSDGAKEETINYSLTGTLVAGTSTITATYGSFADTFDVVVSAVAVTSISCTYTQSKTVYDSDSLDVLKDDLVVNAVYSDGSSGTVSASDYTLSGTLNEGTSTITVSYGGKTDTFNVTVTHLAGSYSVANSLTNCTNSNGASSVIENESYSGTITANAGYTMTGATVSITMGGTDITSTAYNNGAISIASVTGNVVITASAVQITDNLIATLALGTHEVYPTDNIQSLKKYLTVELHNGGTTTPVSEYTLSGSIDSVGTHVITISYNNYTTTVNVPVVANTTGILYEWDFTDSLTDLRQNQTALLQTGEAWEIPGKSEGTTIPVQGSTGVVLNDAQQLIRLLGSSFETTQFLINKTIQIDFAEFTPQGSFDEMRLLLTGWNKNNDGRIVFELGLTHQGITSAHDARWGVNYITNSSKAQGVEAISSGNRGDISGKTISAYIDNNGYWTMYIGNELKGTAEISVLNSYVSRIYGLQIGSGGRTQYGGTLYSGRVTGARIYSGNAMQQ